MIAPAIQFDTAFEALTDHTPMRWQRRLFDQLGSGGEIPRVCNLPTGLGKTSVIPIWTIALACQAQYGAIPLPRRLVYIINRRTVVDQATNVVVKLRDRLKNPDDTQWSQHAETLHSLANALKSLSSLNGEDSPLAVSTLRGELADNSEWKGNPARAAVIIGTIDMIGSKLLFSGYGDGRYWRAQHAGLLGQDALIVHDEAHLTPAFSKLLREIADVQSQAHECRPVQVMELSATARDSDGRMLGLAPEDERDDTVQARIHAAKTLRLHHAEAKKTEERLVELALAHKDASKKVLIYVQSPEEAQKALDSLNRGLGKDADGHTDLLTGTMRGYERDKLVKRPVYQAMANPDTPTVRTVYLVTTSAGEVGVDIDADYLVCDLTTLDSLVQRLGRVNRRGGKERHAQVDVVVEEPDGKGKLTEFQQAAKATQDILRKWVADAGGALGVSPHNLRALLDTLTDKERENAFAPKPQVPTLTDILLDAWSLTTITKPMPGRPKVVAYLHGLENEPPETYVAWRREVRRLADAMVKPDELGDWFQACPIEARERLRDRMDRVKRLLASLLENQRKQARRPKLDFPVMLLDERGEAEQRYLVEIVEKDFPLAYRTVVLPVEAGGLGETGTLDASALDSISDVGDAPVDGAEDGAPQRQRWLHIRNVDGEPGQERYERLTTGAQAPEPPPDLRERERIPLREPEDGEDPAGEARYLVVLTAAEQLALEASETAKVKQRLSFHSRRIVEEMQCLAAALGLEANLSEALALAAQWHDQGKANDVWQWYAYNPAPGEPLAKNTRYRSPRLLGGYRHEFGSLLQAMRDEQIRSHPEADLILHLIAAHHGRARPHFEHAAWDNTHTTAENEEAAAEVMRRFARLQQRFGRWGLAWLEALLRCADVAASKTSE